MIEFCEELRNEGLQVGTAQVLDAFAAVQQIDWTSAEVFRGAMAATLAKSQQDQHVFELVFDRFFFRAAEKRNAELQSESAEQQQGDEDPDAATEQGQAGDGQQVDIDDLREAILAAVQAGNSGALRDLARLAVMALAAGEGSGVVGVDVQRIRRALEIRMQDLPPELKGDAQRRQIYQFERDLRKELEARR
ncbi:MAG: hypothetical protein JHC87_04670, partial [Thermoleophilaceae bacterium]|nr:hypothetical protein [Thermoleophilaceae bacterium]